MNVWVNSVSCPHSPRERSAMCCPGPVFFVKAWGLRRAERLCFRVFLLIGVCLLAPTGWTQEAPPEPLVVAVASNFAGPARQLAVAFTEQTGVPVQVIVGSTGLLYAQIVQGAPFDVLLAADTERPLSLEDMGLGAADSYAVYARGRLALWVPGSARPPDPGDYLTRASLLAHANPDMAPYGAAAAAITERFPKAQAERQIVRGQSISATYTQVASGAVPAGLVAYSQLLAGEVPAEEYSLIPEIWHPPIAQALILTVRGAGRRAGWEFQRFLLSDETLQKLLSLGYARSDGKAEYDGN